MDDFLGNNLPRKRLQGAFYPQINLPAEFLFKIPPDPQKIAQSFLVGHEFYGNVNVRIFADLSTCETAEESDAHNAEALCELVLMRLQECDDFAPIINHTKPLGVYWRSILLP